MNVKNWKFELLKIEKLLIVYSVLVLLFDVHSTLIVMNKYGLYHETIRERNNIFWMFLEFTGSRYTALFLSSLIALSILVLLIMSNRIVESSIGSQYHKLYCLYLFFLPVFAPINNYFIWYIEPNLNVTWSNIPLLVLVIIEFLSLVVSVTVIATVVISLLALGEKKPQDYLESLEKYRKRRREDLCFYVSALTVIIIVLVYVVITNYTFLLLIIACGCIGLFIYRITDSVYRYKYRIEKSYEKARKRAGLG